MTLASDAPGEDTLLRLWLYGVLVRPDSVQRCEEHKRWEALEELSRRLDALSPLLFRLARIVELGYRCSRFGLRRRAAIGLIRLCEGRPPDSLRLQVALARAISLALPRRLSAPHIVPTLLSDGECDALVAECDAHGGWGSLHRKYSTVDLPVEKLACGARIEAIVAERLLPRFGEKFGERYGPPAQLRFRNLFVAKYEVGGGAQADELAGHPAPQPGLAYHVDESLLSMVLQLSADDDFEGGGTCFEGRRADLVVKPGRGGAVLFLGKVYHAAAPITRGRRLVLVALVDRVTPSETIPEA